MRKITKNSLIIFTVFTLIVFFSWTPALAQYSTRTSEKNGDKMTADLFIMRPIGFAATVAGSAFFILSLPFSALGGNHEEAFEKLVKKPANYTFKRPLGDF
jgi:hypothetical protein